MSAKDVLKGFEKMALENPELAEKVAANILEKIASKWDKVIEEYVAKGDYQTAANIIKGLKPGFSESFKAGSTGPNGSPLVNAVRGLPYGDKAINDFNLTSIRAGLKHIPEAGRNHPRITDSIHAARGKTYANLRHAIEVAPTPSVRNKKLQKAREAIENGVDNDTMMLKRQAGRDRILEASNKLK